jgi:predicted TIM-barrel fold metal-dependent hydrolase
LLAAAEVHRLAEIGTKAISFPDGPVPLGLPSFHHPTHWEPMWQACVAAKMPVCLHFGAGSFVPGFSFADKEHPDPYAPFASAIAIYGTNLMWTTSDLVFSGVLQRHPELNFMLSEGGIGWIPWIMERLDYTWDRHRWYQNISKSDRPSDLFKKHFYGCFIDDWHGIENRHTIGVDNILVEVDYPHSDSNWPNSRKRIAENLASVPDDEVAKIVEHNARELMNFYL